MGSHIVKEYTGAREAVSMGTTRVDLGSKAVGGLSRDTYVTLSGCFACTPAASWQPGRRPALPRLSMRSLLRMVGGRIALVRDGKSRTTQLQLEARCAGILG